MLALSAAQAVASDMAGAASAPYDLAAVELRLSLPFRHRQAFGSHALADGAVTSAMLNSLNAYQFDYGEGPGTLHALGVFYGTSVAMLVDDAAWRKYQLAVVQQRRGDPARRHAENGGNPYARPTSALDPAAARSDLHGLYHDASIAALSSRGASFFVCDNALRGLATDIAVAYAMSDEPVGNVHADLRAHVVPGAMLVPAGVAAINQAQEMKFTFLTASL